MFSVLGELVLHSFTAEALNGVPMMWLEGMNLFRSPSAKFSNYQSIIYLFIYG